jgi:hypothetical protein
VISLAVAAAGWVGVSSPGDYAAVQFPPLPRHDPKARDIAARMRAGNVHINYPMGDLGAPFGGYKQSGNGREYAEFGLEEFLETKAVIGYEAA